jgi:hypothetical protein
MTQAVPEQRSIGESLVESPEFMMNKNGLRRFPDARRKLVEVMVYQSFPRSGVVTAR